MDLQLKGHTVLVTGSSSGIGRAAAIAFGAEGAQVAVTYHKNREGAEETASGVRILSNIVMPGAVMTERTQQHMSDEQREQIRQRAPTRQLTTPEDVAAVIVFLGSPVNRQITGETVRVTGGR